MLGATSCLRLQPAVCNSDATNHWHAAWIVAQLHRKKNLQVPSEVRIVCRLTYRQGCYSVSLMNKAVDLVDESSACTLLTHYNRR